MANLYYLIGASGAGKDSLIQYARAHLPVDANVVFTHRYITRPADSGGENHIALEKTEFNARRNMQCFAMSWYSHDTHYGIGIEINQWLAKGLNVVMNGSRAYLDTATKKYRELVPVHLSVKPDVLKQRLLKRGRENKQQIEKRLVQARQLELTLSHPKLVIIENNGDLHDAGDKFIRVIQNQRHEKCA